MKDTVWKIRWIAPWRINPEVVLWSHPNPHMYVSVYLLIYKGALQGRVGNLLEFNRETTWQAPYKSRQLPGGRRWWSSSHAFWARVSSRGLQAAVEKRREGLERKAWETPRVLGQAYSVSIWTAIQRRDRKGTGEVLLWLRTQKSLQISVLQACEQLPWILCSLSFHFNLL